MNKRVTIFMFIIASFLILSSTHEVFSQNIGSAAFINVNNIYLPFDNKGDISNVITSGNYLHGYYAGHEFLFAAGFWLSGHNDTILWANGMASGYPGDYQAGIVGMDPNNTEASLYRLSSVDPPFGQSWQDWNDAVSLGADFYDGDGDGVYNPVDLNNNGVWDTDEDKPDIIGDECYWCVYNDGVPSNERLWGSEPQGIEIRQTIFAFASAETLGNVVFIRYRIRNTGLVADTLEDVYFCNFIDSDIGEEVGFTMNYVGCDTIRNASYTYCKTSTPEWGSQPPCFMTDMLTGPLSYIPGVSFEDINGNNIYDEGIDIPLDTAYSFRGPLGVPVYPGASNLQLTSSVFFNLENPSLDLPTNISQVRNNLFGLNRFGDTIDPCNWSYGEVLGGVPCEEVNPYYWCSGNPVSNIGWISVVPTDVRNIQSTGPFKLIKDKDIEILVGYEIGQGNTPLGSVTEAGNVSDEIQDFYENNFGYPFVLGVKDKNIDKLDYSLSQNYPNPFNPATKIRYELPRDGMVTIEVFNVLGQRVKTLLNKYQKADRYEVEFNGTGLASGIYIYRMRVNDFITSKKMVFLK